MRVYREVDAGAITLRPPSPVLSQHGFWARVFGLFQRSCADAGRAD
jgi:hypothetical protein